MIGFLFPMHMALVITTIYYMLGYNPMLSHQRGEDAPVQSNHKPNPVDLFLFQLFHLEQIQAAPTALDDNERQDAPTEVDGDATQAAPAEASGDETQIPPIVSNSDQPMKWNERISAAFGTVNIIQHHLSPKKVSDEQSN
jgi:hypothetical protein